MKRVFITEKPSVAKALAEHLGVAERKNGYFLLRNGDVVTNLIGHLIVQAEPDHYLPASARGKRWSFDTLPIIPKEWASFPKPETTERGQVKMRDGKPVPIAQLGIVVGLLKRAEIIVNAGDIDREGQLVADEVIEYAGFPADGSAKPVERVLMVALDPASLDKALSRRRQNGEPEFINRRMAALARSRADWLVGMNGSRAYSARANANISVGRVQTPTLNLVVRRDELIENFKPKTYFVPMVRLPNGLELEWTGRVDGADGRGIDEEGRIIDRRIAEGIVERIKRGLEAEIVEITSDEKEEAPPLPFNLSKLQVEMSRKHNMSASATSKAAQGLYERHKAITYVGTDCQFLPEAQHSEGPDVLKQISSRFMKYLNGANPAIKHACWNDKKVTAHHAIIPTGVVPSGLSQEEQHLYEAISKRYIAQFHPKYRYLSNSITANFGEDVFEASETAPLVLGWRAVEGLPKASIKGAAGGAKAGLDEEDENQEASPRERKERKKQEQARQQHKDD